MGASFPNHRATATGAESSLQQSEVVSSPGYASVREGEEGLTSFTAMDEATTEEQLQQEAPADIGEGPIATAEQPEATPEATAEEPETEAEPTAEQPETEAGSVVTDEAVKSDAPEADEDDVVQVATNADVIASKPGRRRRVLMILSSVLAVLVLAAIAGVAYATYDFKAEHDGRILPGATVAGVDVGGMTERQAVRAVRKEIAPRLERTITVSSGDQEWEVTPEELGARNNARAAVRAALAASEEASWTELAGMRFLNEDLDLEKDVSIRHSRDGASEFIASLEKDVNAEPVDAALDYSSGWVEITKAKVGFELSVDKSTESLLKALRNGNGSAELSVRELAPAVTADSFDQVILLRQNDFRVYLYENGKITHDWPVAIGTSEYPTPTGLYSVELKRYMPTWVNPAPDGWGADMPAMIPPGPDNPLGMRAINWTAPAIRFHGTSSLSSIGTPASHGCVRMFNEDVIELYDLVDEGSPIVSTWG